MDDTSEIIAQLQKRLRILEDKDQLASLLNRYCNTADAHDWDGYADCYVDDAVMTFESWGDVVGKEAILKAASVEQRFEGLQHSMTNMQFEVDGSDKATGTAYLWFCATPSVSQPEVNYSFGGPYKFEFTRATDGWRLSRMRLRKNWAHGKDTEKVFGDVSNSPTIGLLYYQQRPFRRHNLSKTMKHDSGTMEGKIGLVTGAGTPMGIGRSLVLKLAEAGATAVYACDLNLSSISLLQKECKDAGHATLVEGRLLDVSSEEQTAAVVKEITRRHGRFDFLFANAGFANYVHLADMDTSHYDRSIAVMQRGVFLGIKYGSQAMMVTSPEKPQPGGTIVVTGSCAGFLGSYSDLAYCVAKTAVNGIVAGASVHLSTSNIRVNGVAPGFTKTSILSVSKDAQKGSEYSTTLSPEQIKQNHMWFLEQAGLLSAPQYYYNRLAEAEEIANVQLFLASDLSKSINGHVILADSGKTAAATGDGCTGPIPPIRALDISSG